MLEFLYNYGLFFAKTITFVIAVVVTFALIFSLKARNKSEEGSFEITDVNERLDEIRDSFEHELLDKADLKKLKKHRKKLAKEQKESDQEKERMFVVRFDGDIRAGQVAELREVVTALLRITHESDEVLVILESGGGYVPHYGLAASQLKRIRDKGVNLTIAIDKIAASGGYLMAVVANKIIAAPFAIVGSIGVLGQLPNFHRLLNKHSIDYEMHYAGKYKRTLTMMGKNTDAARKKFQEDLEQTHVLFKNFIDEHRPQVDTTKVATGEYWHASDAFELNMIDVITTSDDYILKCHPEKEIFEVSYVTKPHLSERISSSLSAVVKNTYDTFMKMFTRADQKAV